MATAFRAPGDPVFLSLFRIAGITDPAGIRLLQVYLSVLIIWLVYVLGKRIFDRKTGLFAAFFTAIYPYYIFMPGTILAATLLTGLILTGSLFLHKAVSEQRPALTAAAAPSSRTNTRIRPTAFIGMSFPQDPQTLQPAELQTEFASMQHYLQPFNHYSGGIQVAGDVLFFGFSFIETR